MSILNKAIEYLRPAELKSARRAAPKSTPDTNAEIVSDVGRMDRSVNAEKRKFDEAFSELNRTRKNVRNFEPVTADTYYLGYLRQDGAREEWHYAGLSDGDTFEGTSKRTFAEKAGEALKGLDRIAEDASTKGRRVTAEGFDEHSSSYHHIASDAEGAARDRRQALNELRDDELHEIEKSLKQNESHNERMQNFASKYPDKATSVEGRVAANDRFITELLGYASKVKNWGS